MHAVVVTIIKSGSGQFFVHRRGAHKGIFAGLYGLGAGGRVEDGEDPAAAARRELTEETGLLTPVRPLFSFSYDASDDALLLAPETAWTVHTHLTIVIDETPIVPYHDEWDWHGWMSPAAVDELQRAGLLCPDTSVLYDRYKDMLAAPVDLPLARIARRRKVP